MSSSQPSSLNFCLLMGPYYSGCSKLATSLTRIIPTTIHVDGTYGLDQSTVSILGDHRNDLSRWTILSAFLQNLEQLPLVSMSPAVLLDGRCQPNLIPYMKTVFGQETVFNIIIFLPKVYASGEPQLVLEDADKQNFLELNSPHWKGLEALYLTKAENPAEEKKSVSAYNILQNTLFSLTDFVRRIVFFPTAVDEIPEPHKQGLIQAVQTLPPPRIGRQPHFVQKRFLTEHGTGEGRKVHHITVEFISVGVHYTPPSSDRLQVHVGSSVTGRFMTCPSTGVLGQFTELHRVATTILGDASLQALIPSHLPLFQVHEALQMMCSSIERVMGDFGLLQDAEFVKTFNTHLGKYRIILDTYKKANQTNELTVLLKSLEDKKWLKVDLKGQIIQFIVFPDLFEGELGTRAHITVNYGPHKPADMRTAAQCVYSGAATISIDACEYRYNTGKNIPVNIMGIYYI
jgi:hypothetical protein